MEISSYILAKRYVDEVLVGAGALQGKSAYQVALDNGFKGSEIEWLESLVGQSPRIGENGHWYIGDKDTGVIASPELSGFYSEANLVALTTEEILEICK
jgi:hypothetical protein